MHERKAAAIDASKERIRLVKMFKACFVLRILMQ